MKEQFVKDKCVVKNSASLCTFVLQTSNGGNGKPSEHSAAEQKLDTPTSSDTGRTENGGKAEVQKAEES